MAGCVLLSLLVMPVAARAQDGALVADELQEMLNTCDTELAQAVLILAESGVTGNAAEQVVAGLADKPGVLQAFTALTNGVIGCATPAENLVADRNPCVESVLSAREPSLGQISRAEEPLLLVWPVLDSWEELYGSVGVQLDPRMLLSQAMEAVGLNPPLDGVLRQTNGVILCGAAPESGANTTNAVIELHGTTWLLVWPVR
jgi:hypothetical protein